MHTEKCAQSVHTLLMAHYGKPALSEEKSENQFMVISLIRNSNWLFRLIILSRFMVVDADNAS